MNAIGEMMKIGVSKGFAFHLLKKYPKDLKKKIEFFKWLLKEKKAYSHNYFVKIVENGASGYYFDEFVQHKRDGEAIKKLKDVAKKGLMRREVGKEKIGQDKTVRRKKNIFNFINNE